MGGIVITDRCNLNCAGCRVANNNGTEISFKQIEKVLRDFYSNGIRSLYIEGGEPFLWRDGDKDLEDILILARKKGFHFTSIYTNGTLPLRSSADVLFVSLDGPKEINDMLRGGGYDKIMENIRSSKHKKIIINCTINSRNHEHIEEFCRTIKTIPQIKGIFFFFHTPYYGKDELFLTHKERRKIIKRILALKNKYRILNSRSVLMAAFRNDWNRPLYTCELYAEGKTYKCCRSIGNDDVCRECGYLAGPELSSILRLNPGAILEALKYL